MVVADTYRSPLRNRVSRCCPACCAARRPLLNVEIMRAFVRLRRAALVSEQVVELVSELARRIDDHDAALKAIVETIQSLVNAPARRTRPIGFVPPNEAVITLMWSRIATTSHRRRLDNRPQAFTEHGRGRARAR